MGSHNKFVNFRRIVRDMSSVSTVPATILLNGSGPIIVKPLVYTPPSDGSGTGSGTGSGSGSGTGSGGGTVIQNTSGPVTSLTTNTINALNPATDSITVTAKNVVVNANLQVQGVLQTTTTTNLQINDKVLYLGAVDANLDGVPDVDDVPRDGAGIVVPGPPQYLPSGIDPTVYEHSMLWLRNQGNFYSDGTIVPPHLQPLWTFNGGGLAISSPDQLNRTAQFYFAPYYSADIAMLGLYYSVDDQVQLVQTFSCAPFGATPLPSVAPAIDTYGMTSKPYEDTMGNGWTLDQMWGGFDTGEDEPAFQAAIAAGGFKSISFYVLESIIPANAGNAVIGYTYWVAASDFAWTLTTFEGHATMRPTVTRALVTPGNHQITPSLTPSVVQNVQHVFNWASVDPASQLSATFHAKVWIDLELPTVAFEVLPVLELAPVWTTDFALSDVAAGASVSIQLSAGTSSYSVAPDGVSAFALFSAGLTLSASTGVLSGTATYATAPGNTVYFVIRATSADGTVYTDRPFSLYVGMYPVWVTPATVPTCTNHVLATLPAFVATGAPSYQRVPIVSLLPSGCTFNAQTATISGTPLVQGTYTFVITAYNSASLYTSQTFTWQID